MHALRRPPWRAKLLGPTLTRLFALGADPNAHPRVSGVTQPLRFKFAPLVYAARSDLHEAVGALVEAGAISVHQLREALRALVEAGRSLSEAESTELVTAMLARGGELHAPSARGWPPLHHAATAGATAIVRALLALGADPLLVDASEGHTALQALEAEGGGEGELPQLLRLSLIHI